MKKVLISPTLGLDLEGITSVIYNYAKAMDRTGLQLSFLTYGELKPAVRQRFEALGEILFVSDRKQSTLGYLTDINPDEITKALNDIKDKKYYKELFV